MKRIRIHFKQTKSPQYEGHCIPILLPTFVLPKECDETIAIVKRRTLKDEGRVLSITYNWPVALYQPILIPLNGQCPHPMDEVQTPRETLIVVDTRLKRKLPREFTLNDENHPKRIKLDRGKMTFLISLISGIFNPHFF